MVRMLLLCLVVGVCAAETGAPHMEIRHLGGAAPFPRVWTSVSGCRTAEEFEQMAADCVAHGVQVVARRPARHLPQVRPQDVLRDPRPEQDRQRREEIRSLRARRDVRRLLPRTRDRPQLVRVHARSPRDHRRTARLLARPGVREAPALLHARRWTLLRRIRPHGRGRGDRAGTPVRRPSAPAHPARESGMGAAGCEAGE